MLDDTQILNILGQELNQSAGGETGGDSVEANRQAALATYLGQPYGNEVEGRSSIVSTDVADAIEWIMPEIVKAFTQNNEVVTFDPAYEGDELQAELESQYTYDILMKDNPGFIVIHQFIKDALMQKNGFIKVFYSDDEKISTDSYTGLTEVEFQLIAADPEIEILELTEEMIDDIPIYDIKVKRTCTTGKINVMSVAPEDFRVNRMHNSVDLSTARFTAHVTTKTRSDLVAEGYSKDEIWALPADGGQGYDENDYRFFMQGETIQGEGVTNDPSLDMVDVIEAYMHMDINEDGIAELVKITAAGSDNSPTFILDIEEINAIPFISSTCILMSHKLFGLSMYDRLKQIQELKTTLWRNILDNIYLQNNQRTIVVENQVNLDDLMISRPGGIIRAKVQGAVQPYTTPPLSAEAYKMMDYADQVRAGRAGVSPEGPVTDSMVGDRVGSQGIAQMMSQKEELVGLMIRVMAETGIKPLCYMIRDHVIQHQDVARDYMFRGQWVKVDPTKWRNRTHTTVRVGTGSGNRMEQQNTLGGIMQFQTQTLQNPNQTLVTDEQQYNVINDMAKAGGLPSAGRYVLDPTSPKGQENAQKVGQQNQQMQEMQKKQEAEVMALQTKIADAEMQKAQTGAMNAQLKNQIDQGKNALVAQKQVSDSQLEAMKQRLAQLETALGQKDKEEELRFKYWDRTKFYALQAKEIEIQNENDKENNDDG